MSERVLRIFVSSPSDVAGERARVKRSLTASTASLKASCGSTSCAGRTPSTLSHIRSSRQSTRRSATCPRPTWCCALSGSVLGSQTHPAIWQRADGSAVPERHRARIRDRGRGEPPAQRHPGRSSSSERLPTVLYRADRASEEMEQYQLLQAVWKRWTESAKATTPPATRASSTPTISRRSSKPACVSGWRGAARRGTGSLWHRVLKGSPFRGLAAFDAAHAAVFFGREAAIARATAKLRQAPIPPLIRGSGSGKSSPLGAGLFARVSRHPCYPRHRPVARNSHRAKRRSAGAARRGNVRRRCARLGTARGRFFESRAARRTVCRWRQSGAET